MKASSFETYGPVPISTYNGMFYSTIVEDGQVGGLWKRVEKKTFVAVDLHPIKPLFTEQVQSHANELSAFLGKDVRVTTREPLEIASGQWPKPAQGQP